MYDGYEKYGAHEAAGYEEERKKELLWWQEEQFISDYFANHKPRIILDAPVGTGRFLDRYGNTDMAVGIDISEEMLKQSSQKLADLRFANIQLMQGDIFKLDFVDNYFDLAICWRFAHLVPENLLADVLRELGRVTGGEILLQTYVGQHYWLRLIASLKRLPAKIYCRLSGTMPHPLPWSHIRAYFHTHKTLFKKIAEAGLIINQRVKIGPYNDSIVYIYQLSKLEYAKSSCNS